MLKRIFASLVMLSLLIPTLTSCGEKTFSHAELYMTLPSSFDAVESAEYDLALTDGEATVGLMRISLVAAMESGIRDTYSPKDFAEFMRDESNIDSEVYTYKDIPYYTVAASSGGRDFYSLYTFYRSKSAYFVIVFTAPKDREEEWREKFLGFADTVNFTDN